MRDLRHFSFLFGLMVTLIACQPPPKPAADEGQGDGGDSKDEGKAPLRPVDLEAAKTIDPESVSTVVEGGGPWDAEGNTVLEGPIVLEYGQTQKKARRFDWSFDRDDEYQVSFLLDRNVVAERIVVIKDNHGKPEGMWRSDHRIPKTARDGGFDAVYIQASGGNGKYSIGHFQLIEDEKAFKKEREAGRRARREAKKKEAAAAAATQGTGATDGGDEAASAAAPEGPTGTKP